MAKFCTRCGRPLEDGEVCACSINTNTNTNTNANVKIDVTAAKGFIESMKNRMGIGEPELNSGDAYESGKLIVPDCVKANDSEIPVKQYTVAKLRNRILGITYTKAIGRIQVTNKRVIFRAPGNSLPGRTTLQHEFAIDEIAGIEARREYVFNIWDLILGIIVSAIGGGITTGLILAMFRESLFYNRNIVGSVLFALIFGLAGCVPFFLIKKKWLLKLLCLGASFYPLVSIGIMAQSARSGFSHFVGAVLIILAVISLIFLLFTLMLYCIRPNLVLTIKPKSVHAVINIKRAKIGFGGKAEENTGYTEVLPEGDAEKCIREINAMINDIQKLGDFGIEKWKA